MSQYEEELKERYAQLTDDALLQLWNKNTLTEVAQVVLRHELQNRDISIPELNNTEELDIIEKIDPWVTVDQFISPQEAHILAGRFESEGIPVVLGNEHIISVNWFLSNAIGGVRVRVPQSYVKQANIIISEDKSGKYEIPDEKEVILCSKCGSNKIVRYKRSWNIAVLILYFFNLPVPFSLEKYKCKVCGNVFKI